MKYIITLAADAVDKNAMLRNENRIITNWCMIYIVKDSFVANFIGLNSKKLEIAFEKCLNVIIKPTTTIRYIAYEKRVL